MTTADNKVCKFNCICNRPDCSFRHYITNVDDRSAFKELLDKLYDKSKHNETDPEGIRRRVCFFGYLCGKEDCGFQHFCNIEGRRLLQKAWFKQSKRNESLAFLDELNEKYSFTDDEVEKLLAMVGAKR